MDNLLGSAAKFFATIRCLPAAEVRHMYAWKALEFAHARARGHEFLTEKVINDWRFWEERYAALGYRTFSILFLEEARSCHYNLNEPKWHEKRGRHEGPVFYATAVRSNFLEGVRS